MGQIITAAAIDNTKLNVIFLIIIFTMSFHYYTIFSKIRFFFTLKYEIFKVPPEEIENKYFSYN